MTCQLAACFHPDYVVAVGGKRYLTGWHVTCWYVTGWHSTGWLWIYALQESLDGLRHVAARGSHACLAARCRLLRGQTCRDLPNLKAATDAAAGGDAPQKNEVWCIQKTVESAYAEAEAEALLAAAF